MVLNNFCKCDNSCSLVSPVIHISFCSWKWIVLYTTSAILLFLFTGVLITLLYLPLEHEYEVVVYDGDVVFIPFWLSTKWLANVTFSSNCFGEVYQVPCLQLESYCMKLDFNPRSVANDQIYLHNGESQFNITWNYDFAGYFWILKDNSQLLDAKANPSKYSSNCDSGPETPSDSQCVYLSPHNSTVLNVTVNSQHGGQYVYIYTHQNVEMVIHVDRKVYNISNYTSKKPLNSNNQVTFRLRDGFQPINFSSSTNDCFLFNSPENTPCYNFHNHQEGHVTVNPVRRLDIIFWPILAASLMLLVLIVALTIQCWICISKIRKKLLI